MNGCLFQLELRVSGSVADGSDCPFQVADVQLLQLAPKSLGSVLLHHLRKFGRDSLKVCDWLVLLHLSGQSTCFMVIAFQLLQSCHLGLLGLQHSGLWSALSTTWTNGHKAQVVALLDANGLHKLWAIVGNQSDFLVIVICVENPVALVLWLLQIEAFSNFGTKGCHSVIPKDVEMLFICLALHLDKEGEGSIRCNQWFCLCTGGLLNSIFGCFCIWFWHGASVIITAFITSTNVKSTSKECANDRLIDGIGVKQHRVWNIGVALHNWWASIIRHVNVSGRSNNDVMVVQDGLDTLTMVNVKRSILAQKLVVGRATKHATCHVHDTLLHLKNSHCPIDRVEPSFKACGSEDLTKRASGVSLAGNFSKKERMGMTFCT